MVKVENKSLLEIEEYLKTITDEETNLSMRCLDCDEYKPLCQMNVETETCDECNRKRFHRFEDIKEDEED